MREDATFHVRGQLALDVARQPAAVRIGLAQFREHGLRVLRDQLVQHRPLGLASTVTGERPSGRAGRAFVEAAREHAGAQWKFRAAIAARTIATFRSAASDARTPVTPSARDTENVEIRPGFIWVHGRWNWQNGNWAWADGHWERERAGYAWSEGRWDRQGNAWHWVEGNWTASSNANIGNAQGGVVVGGGGGGNWNDGNNGGWNTNNGGNTGTAQGGVVVSGGGGGGGSVTVSAYPTAAPPPIRVENYNPRAGFVWITGRWDWRNGNWSWVDGHYERERANMVWYPGQWQLQGNAYVWVDGRWDVGNSQPQGPIVRDHR